MSLREPITPESLCVALNRATSLRLAPRDVVLAYHHWRWVAHVPDQRIAFVADTVDARQRAPSEPPLATSIERTRVNLAIGIDDAALQAQVQEGLALFDALEIGNNEVVLVHG